MCPTPVPPGLGGASCVGTMMGTVGREGRQTMKTGPLAAGAAALSLLLGGCSAIKVSSSEDAASKPAQVGISDEKSTASPSPTGVTIPEGMTETTVELGAECPVEVSLALGPDWADGSGYE